MKIYISNQLHSITGILRNLTSPSHPPTMTKFLVYLLFSLFTAHAHAQRPIHDVKKLSHRKMKTLDSSGWEKTGFLLLNINQAANNEWSGGGENFLIGINGLINYAIHHQMGKYSLDTYVDIELGAVEASSFHHFRKTSDHCDLTIEFEHILGKKTNYGLLFNFNSQLFTGRNYASPEFEKITSFLSPGKFILAPGIDIKFKSESSYLSFFISPSTLKWVTKLDNHFYNQAKFGVDSASKITTEFGAYFSAHCNVRISKNSSYITRLDFFSNYLNKPGNMDILMNNLLSINISRVFSANIIVDVIYDEDVRSRTQVQEIFGLGLKLNL